MSLLRPGNGPAIRIWGCGGDKTPLQGVIVEELIDLPQATSRPLRDGGKSAGHGGRSSSYLRRTAVEDSRFQLMRIS